MAPAMLVLPFRFSRDRTGLEVSSILVRHSKLIYTSVLVEGLLALLGFNICAIRSLNHFMFS